MTRRKVSYFYSWLRYFGIPGLSVPQWRPPHLDYEITDPLRTLYAVIIKE